MVNNAQPQEDRGYVAWDARRFQGVRSLSDYLRLKARRPSSGAGGIGNVQNADGTSWWRKLAMGEKIGVISAAATIAGVAATIISLVIH